MNQELTFNEFFGKPVLVKIINLFLEDSDSQFTQKQIIIKLKLAKASAVKWLRFLGELNLIKIEKRAVEKIYTLNKDYYIIKQLKILNNLMKLELIKRLAEEYHVKGYLYGSSARGEDVKESDIDILFLGKVRKEKIIQDIKRISTKINKNIKVEIYSEIEWAQMARKDSAFYERVEKDKIEL